MNTQEPPSADDARGEALSITQTAEDRAIQIGQVFGNVYAYYATSSQTADISSVDVDVNSLLTHADQNLSAWDRNYTELTAIRNAAPGSGSNVDNDQPNVTSLTECLHFARRLLVVGDAGSGKTSALKHIAKTTCSRILSDEQAEVDCCLYIELGRFRKRTGFSALDSILVLMGDAVQLWGGSEGLLPLEALRRFLKERRLLLLFDGLNEVSFDVRTECLRGVQDLAARYEQQKIVVSTRTFHVPRLADWLTVRLATLDDTQFSKFAAVYGDSSTASVVSALHGGSTNKLLRTPLFLRMACDLASSGGPRVEHLSRSGLVSQYAAYLIDSGREFDQITRAQICVAVEMIAALIQTAGTSMPLQQIDAGLKAAIADGRLSLSSAEVIEILLEKNIFVSDGRHIRFWHQALQEHFYARYFATRLRAHGEQILRSPSKVRRALLSRSEEDAFAHLVAVVTEAELRLLFEAALRSNLSLAIRWADDLSCEQRWQHFVNDCVNAVRIRVRRIAKAQTVVALQDWLCTPKLVYIQIAFCLILLIAWPLVAIVAIGLHLVGLVLRGARLSPIVESKPLIIVALRGIGSNSLRERLAVDLATIVRAPEIDIGNTQTLGIGDKSEAELLQEELEWSVSDDENLFTRLSYLEYLDGESVLPFLINVTQRRNCYARRALNVMQRRVIRFPSERAQIEAVARKIYDDTTINFLVRGQARRLLRAVGVNVGLVRDFFSRRLKRWLVLWSVVICTFLVLLLLGTAFLLIRNRELRGVVQQCFGLCLLALPLWVLNDASNLGARSIKGCLYWDGLGPEHYALLVFLLWLIFLPAYLLARGRIRENHREGTASESSVPRYSVTSGLGLR